MSGVFRSRNLICLLFFCSLFSSGCSRFFHEPMRVPEGALEIPGIEALRGEAVTPADFAAVFPPIDTFIMSTRIKAKYRRFLGTTYFEMSMATASPKLLRIAGRHPGDRTTVFDMVLDFPKMHVYLPLSQAYYRGQISEEGSPFGSGFGVEPWDLIPIIEIGRRLSLADFTPESTINGTQLWMSDRDLSADGLESVVLEKASGLPERAYWRRGEVMHQVVYEAWDLFESINNPGEMHLLPTEFYVLRNDPYARIEVRPRKELQQYKIEPELSAKTFELIFPQATSFYELEELNDLLGG